MVVSRVVVVVAVVAGASGALLAGIVMGGTCVLLGGEAIVSISHRKQRAG